MNYILSLISLGILLLSASDLWACSVCFVGDTNASVITALRNAIIVLLVALLVVMVFLVKFFMGIARRSKNHTTESHA